MKDDKGNLDLTKQIEDLKKKVREAEGELSIIKGIGQSSPEMRDLKIQIEQLEKDNNELRRDNTLLAHDVATLNNRLNEMNPLPGLRRKGF